MNRKLLVIIISLWSFATATATEYDWFPFRTEARGEIASWESDGNRMVRSLAALEVALPLAYGFSAGPAVTVGRLDVTRRQPESKAPHQLGFGAVIRCDQTLTHVVTLHLVARGDGQRQRVDEELPLGAGAVNRRQTITAYHAVGFAEFGIKIEEWELAPYAGAAGDRIDREIAIDNWCSSTVHWSGMQAAGGVRLLRRFGDYDCSVALTAGGEKRMSVILAVGHTGR